MEAAASFEGRITVIDLRTIRPWDRQAVLESVRRCGKELLVHEDSLTAGFAGEIITTISAEAFTDLDAPPQRLAVLDIPIPFSVNAVEAILPNVGSIREKMKEMLEF